MFEDQPVTTLLDAAKVPRYIGAGTPLPESRSPARFSFKENRPMVFVV